MHDSVMKFVQDNLYMTEVVGRYVLEVGSKNVNGGVRDWITKNLFPMSYLGVDMEGGPGVDVICRAEELVAVVWPMRKSTYDIVISTEMLEHCEDWRSAVSNMKRMTHPNGILIITTRSPGFPRHEHPSDFWRFTADDFLKIFADMKMEAVSDPQTDHPGVFMKAKPMHDRCDAVDLSKIEVAKAPEAGE